MCFVVGVFCKKFYETEVKKGDFRLTHVLPEFKISDEDRVDLLITAEQYQNVRPFILFDCKRWPFQKPGHPSLTP